MAGEHNKNTSTPEEYVPTPEEIEMWERQAQEASDYNFQMQQIEDAMWQEGVRALIKNGIKPLLVF